MTPNEILEFFYGIAIFALPATFLYSIINLRNINKETKKIEDSY